MDAGNPSYAWVVGFGNGLVNGFKNVDGYVRAVRSGL
jgi:hypothetical protein